MQTTKNEPIVVSIHTLDPHGWVARHADYLYAYAVTRISDEELARDIVQETFLAALVRVEKFEGKSSERTWLTAILKNKIIDIYRKKSSGFLKRTETLHDENGQQDFFEEVAGHWMPQHAPRAFGIESYDPLADKEFNQILRKCMQKLPSLWLSVFTMKHVDELDTKIICHELNVTPSNFWVIIHRAKVNLRACLQKNWI
jgi:RNA polymerase sigma-70 factor (ECF subfamily)